MAVIASRDGGVWRIVNRSERPVLVEATREKLREGVTVEPGGVYVARWAAVWALTGDGEVLCLSAERR